jgi:hypothetical protein
MRKLAGFGVLALSSILWLPAQIKVPAPQTDPVRPKPAGAAVETAHVEHPGPVVTVPTTERLTYGVEWRLVRAGSVVAETRSNWGHLKLDSAGLVSKLYKIDDAYSVNFEDSYCATNSVFDAQEGKRHHETRVQYDRAQNHAFYTERDVTANSLVRSESVAVPNCVHDPIGALLKLREMETEPGKTLELPISDGRKFASVKMTAQAREEIKTSLGSFKTVRYEAGLMNGVVYRRKGRLFVWLTDDERRLPVQIQVRLGFPVGTVTLGLEKEEHF